MAWYPMEVLGVHRGVRARKTRRNPSQCHRAHCHERQWLAACPARAPNNQGRDGLIITGNYTHKLTNATMRIPRRSGARRPIDDSPMPRPPCGLASSMGRDHSGQTPFPFLVWTDGQPSLRALRSSPRGGPCVRRNRPSRLMESGASMVVCALRAPCPRKASSTIMRSCGFFGALSPPAVWMLS